MKKLTITVLTCLLLGTNLLIAQENQKIQVALLLDTSNSMDGLIEQTKSQLWKIVNELSDARFEGVEPDLSIALYEYGNDNLSVTSGYVRMILPLTNDLDKISGELFALKTNGGSEYCGHVIQTATERLSWSKGENDLRFIYIAGNESFAQGSVDFVEAIAGAKAKNIIVNSIFCGPWERGIALKWQDASTRADGDFMNIDQDEKTVYIPSPYDDKVLDLNKQLNDTYKEYGDPQQARVTYQRTQDHNAASYSKANMVSRALSKSKKAYQNSSWDMVDAYESDPKFLDKAEKDKLPKEYQTLSAKGLKEKIEILSKQRAKIKEEISILEIKRKKHIADERKKQAEEGGKSLDTEMMKSVRKQAIKKNYRFK